MIPKIQSKTIQDVGLGYITLGQQTTLAEAQRIKLAGIIKRYRQHFYILDEPTTGLHFEDIRADGSYQIDKGNTI
jgi:excinuclease ABC subunit A